MLTPNWSTKARILEVKRERKRGQSQQKWFGFERPKALELLTRVPASIYDRVDETLVERRSLPIREQGIPDSVRAARSGEKRSSSNGTCGPCTEILLIVTTESNSATSIANLRPQPTSSAPVRHIRSFTIEFRDRERYHTNVVICVDSRWINIWTDIRIKFYPVKIYENLCQCIRDVTS